MPIDLSEFRPLLEQFEGSLNLVSAAKHLALMPQQLVKLSDEGGVIQPFFTRPSANLKPRRYFRREDLDNFLDRLTTTNVRVKRRQIGLVNIWEADLKTCRQPSAIIEALTDARIRRAFQPGGMPTLRDVLLQVDEVRAAMVDR